MDISKELRRLAAQAGMEPSKIKTDSRSFRKGDTFVAVKGVSHDGHDHISEVIGKGAAEIWCERVPERESVRKDVKFVVVDDTRKALALIAREVYGDPTKHMKIYGVTGTNGKSTTAFLVQQVLNLAGVKCGLVSTVFNNIEGDVYKTANMTTPDVFTMNSFLAEMLSNGKSAAAIEVSSHALSQDRAFGVRLDSAVFTNITPEHLDYHKTMEAYLKDKSKIFSLLRSGGTGIINIDDARLVKLKDNIRAPKLATFGIRNAADVRGTGIKMTASGTAFTVNTTCFGSFDAHIPLLGVHNVYNTLGAIAALLYGGISVPIIKSALEKVLPMPGRLDPITGHKAPFDIFVDYAHTPDALETVLTCLRGITPKKLICVFGCGGDRDRTKRPVMGAIAAKLSDMVVLTSDNPRSEDPEAILREIEKGITAKRNYSIISRREDAIRRSLEAAGKGDVVLIAGKGHEDYQIIGTKTFHFNDKETAGKILAELGY